MADPALCSSFISIRQTRVFHIDDLIADGKTINAKSILNIMAAGIKSSTEIEIQCDGADEESAMKELLQAFENNFGE